MAKHTTQEILAAYSKGSEHSREAAALATYNMGYTAGEEDTKVRILTRDPELHKELETRDQAAKAAAAPPAPEHTAQEDEHNRQAARKRELADEDQDEGKHAATDKKPAASSHSTKAHR